MLLLGSDEAFDEWNRRVQETARTREWRSTQVDNLPNALTYMLSQPGGRRAWESYSMMPPSTTAPVEEVISSVDCLGAGEGPSEAGQDSQGAAAFAVAGVAP